MTDPLTGKEDIQRILDYTESVAKESRKALTLEFNQNHKGIPFETASQVLRTSLIDWFLKRDKNLRITYESGNVTRIGEVRTVFLGETKKVRFKIHADATFTVTGGSPASPCYLKELIVAVDKRPL